MIIHVVPRAAPFLIRARLNPGTYYIRVTGFASDTGDYFIQVDDDSIDDHSDIRFTATKIELNTSISGTIDPGIDVDYFSIDISTPTFVTIFTTGGLTTLGKLINSMGTELTFEDASLGSGGNFRISTRLDDLETYYIEVSSLFGDAGNYDLHAK